MTHIAQSRLQRELHFEAMRDKCFLSQLRIDILVSFLLQYIAI